MTVHRLIPLFKDWNEVLQHWAEITDGKYLREAIYGLKEPPQEETVEIIRMSEVDTQNVEWLWEPYIPFGKVTIVQGNPGEGKTTFALRLAAALPMLPSVPGAPLSLSDISTKLPEAECVPGIRFYRLPRSSKERPADRAREARAECARYRP